MLAVPILLGAFVLPSRTAAAGETIPPIDIPAMMEQGLTQARAQKKDLLVYLADGPWEAAGDVFVLIGDGCPETCALVESAMKERDVARILGTLAGAAGRRA